MKHSLKYSFIALLTALSLLVNAFSVSPAFAAAGDTTRVSVDSSGAQANNYSISPATSADGRYVVFRSSASNLVSGDTNGVEDIFVHDRTTGATTRVSVDSSGAQANNNSWAPAISADGRYVVFDSYASNLVSGDTNDYRDIFVHDRTTGATTRVSVDSSGAQADGVSWDPAISDDGQYVVFQSYASNLVSGDTNNTDDIFLHDRTTGVTTRVSVDSSGAQADSVSWEPAISADGQYVVFRSYASNLVSGDTNNKDDIFVHDRTTGATTRVSVDSSGAQANDGSYVPAISADGRYVVFKSIASNLVSGDTNNTYDVFVHDRTTGATTRVSVDSSGAQANNASGSPAISADGQYVVFESIASNLVSGDTNNYGDIFVHDRTTGVTTRVSVDSSGAQADSLSLESAISADGQYVVFRSYATNLVSGDTNSSADIFVHGLGGTPTVNYELQVSGSYNYLSGDPAMDIATGLTATSTPSGGTIDGARVVIGSGFQSGDVLSVTNSGGVTSSYDSGSGVLTLSGTADVSVYQTVLGSVQFSTTSTNAGVRTITYSLGAAVPHDGSGHFYEFVSSPVIQWTSARDAAAARSYFGQTGYLATITDANENAFATTKLAGQGAWLGGSDAAVEGEWRWVTGPEAGTLFCTDVLSGQGGCSDGGQYDNWSGGQPDNYWLNGSPEHYLQFLAGGTGNWNDLPTSGFDSGWIQGYVVEYGGLAGDTPMDISGSVTVDVDVNHTVTFYGNGNDGGSMSAQTSSSTDKLTANAFTRTGYTFSGWNTLANGTGTPYTNQQSYDFSANLDLYAQWVAASAPTVSTDSIETLNDREVNATLSNLGEPASVSAYGVVYNTTSNPDTSDSMVDRGSTTTTGAYTIGLDEMGLTPGTKYYVRAFATNATGTSYGAELVVYGTPGAFTIIAPLDGATDISTSPTLSWNASTGADDYQYCVSTDIADCAGDMFGPNWHSTGGATSVNLSGLLSGTDYVWAVRAVVGTPPSYKWATDAPFDFTTAAASSYTVTFDANGGSGSMSDQSASSATALTTNTFTRPGFTFTGWNTAANGSGTAYADGATYSFSADVTLYAQWLALSGRIIVPANGSHDGWVLESSETSETGKMFDFTSTVLLVGDDASDRQYRSVISFDTSSLPDTAVVTQAVLSFRINEVVGDGNIIKAFNYFMADVASGWFGSSSSLAPQDFGFSPTLTSGPLNVKNVGSWYYLDLKTGKAAVNPTGLTQVRLRFNLGDNDNGIANLLKIYSGNSNIKPQLNLWYSIP